MSILCSRRPKPSSSFPASTSASAGSIVTWLISAQAALFSPEFGSFYYRASSLRPSSFASHSSPHWRRGQAAVCRWAKATRTTTACKMFVPLSKLERVIWNAASGCLCISISRQKRRPPAASADTGTGPLVDLLATWPKTIEC